MDQINLLAKKGRLYPVFANIRHYMGFFQDTVVYKYLKVIDTNLISQAYSRYAEHFHNLKIQENIRNSKEEQYQGEFLIDLFVKVLGYTKTPTTTLI